MIKVEDNKLTIGGDGKTLVYEVLHIVFSLQAENPNVPFREMISDFLKDDEAFRLHQEATREDRERYIYR